MNELIKPGDKNVFRRHAVFMMDKRASSGESAVGVDQAGTRTSPSTPHNFSLSQDTPPGPPAHVDLELSHPPAVAASRGGDEPLMSIEDSARGTRDVRGTMHTLCITPVNQPKPCS